MNPFGEASTGLSLIVNIFFTWHIMLILLGRYVYQASSDWTLTKCFILGFSASGTEPDKCLLYLVTLSIVFKKRIRRYCKMPKDNMPDQLPKQLKVDLVCMKIVLYQKEHTIFVLLGLAHFTKYNGLQLGSFCCKW